MTATTPTAPTAHTPSPVETLPNQLLTALGQHRMATTSQLHALLRPHARRQTVNTPLNELRRENLVDYTVLPQSRRTRAWYLTGDGARMVKDFPALRGRPPYPITSATAASLKTPHTLTVLRTHLAFVADARPARRRARPPGLDTRGVPPPQRQRESHHGRADALHAHRSRAADQAQGVRRGRPHHHEQ
ncbi:hypothetical protein GCM10010377_76050 [Streptomyces viridiviolaceus]|nr:hypothetical protein GCM10010377_76050 [Streptomyces viridiviolaceus]